MKWKDLEKFLNQIDMVFDKKRSTMQFNPDNECCPNVDKGVCFRDKKDRRIWLQFADIADYGKIELVFKTTHYFDKNDEFINASGSTFEEFIANLKEDLYFDSCEFNEDDFIDSLNPKQPKDMKDLVCIFNWMKKVNKHLENYEKSN